MELQVFRAAASYATAVIAASAALMLLYISVRGEQRTGFRLLAAFFGLGAARFALGGIGLYFGSLAVWIASDVTLALAGAMLLLAAQGIARQKRWVVAAILAAAIAAAHAILVPAARAGGSIPVASIVVLQAVAHFWAAASMFRLGRAPDQGGYRLVAFAFAAHGVQLLIGFAPIGGAAAIQRWQIAGSLLFIFECFVVVLVELFAQWQAAQRARAEAQRSEQALKASAEQTAAILEALPVGIVIASIDTGERRFVNAAWTRLRGFSAAEATGTRTTEVASGWTDMAERRRVLAPVIERGEPVAFERELSTASGGLMHALVSVSRIEYQGESCAVSAYHDITELARARTAAQRAAENFVRLFEISAIPVTVNGSDDARYLAVNAAWCRAFGWSREEIIGRSAYEIDLWVDPAQRSEIVARTRAEGGLRNLPVRLRRRSGEVLEILLSATPIDWSGEPALIFVPQDVTALQRQADEIRELNASLEHMVGQRTAALERANRELEMFSYSISHDLRAPLRAVAGFSTILAENPSVRRDAEATTLATRVSNAAVRMGDMVNELLRYSRLSNQALTTSTVRLADEIELLRGDAQPLLAGRRVRWEIGALPSVRADPMLLRLVLQNLIDNALKYTQPREEAVIGIGARRVEGGLEIQVRDNGVGFDMQYAGKLFGVFQRLHSEREFEGTGIGLAHAQRIMQRHGGSIRAEAAPDRGATFTLFLPDAEAGSAEPQRA